MSTLELTASDGHRLAAWKGEPSGSPRGAVVIVQERESAPTLPDDLVAAGLCRRLLSGDRFRDARQVHGVAVYFSATHSAVAFLARPDPLGALHSVGEVRSVVAGRGILGRVDVVCGLPGLAAHGLVEEVAHASERDELVAVLDPHE